MQLRALAHVRSGDKGDTAQISVIAYRPEDYPLLARELTEARVAAHFRGLASRRITRFALPQLGALNFVIDGALQGGVTRSAAQDAHGKTLAMQLLSLDIAERD